MLRVRPSDALLPILHAAQSATLEITGKEGDIEGVPSGSWIPHATVSYSTAEQSAGPIISALDGKCPAPEELYVGAITLVVQWGPERLWNWVPVGIARLLGRAVC